MGDPSVMRDGIDVHAHFLPAFYVEALEEAGQSPPDGIPRLPQWSPALALEAMDEAGIQTAMLSISSPGVHFGDSQKACSLARRVNLDGAELRARYGGRFGQLASVPLPDVESAIEETAFVFDQLKADGLVIETHHQGVYLGDPLMEPFYAELNKRAAVVLIHPTAPACVCSERIAARIPAPVLEFMFDTTRAVVDLVISGVLHRHPQIKFIVPHAGAALSVLTNRVDLALKVLTKSPDEAPPPSVREAMKQLHFDLAGAPVPELLGALLAIADPQRIHYGSDFPFTPALACRMLSRQLFQRGLLSDPVRADVWRNNAARLFPNLPAAGSSEGVSR